MNTANFNQSINQGLILQQQQQQQQQQQHQQQQHLQHQQGQQIQMQLIQQPVVQHLQQGNLNSGAQPVAPTPNAPIVDQQKLDNVSKVKSLVMPLKESLAVILFFLLEHLCIGYL